jgi:O-antigen/teichoic acid export membrane protein
MISISKKDIWWSYFARFFDIAAGIIILPMILHMLSVEEIGMNYLMLTVGSLVTLIDFGFSPQFGRNITYVFSGANELKKEGVEVANSGSTINYRLLSTMIHTARYVYRRMSVIVLLLITTFGSAYIYRVTEGFSNVENSLVIWLIFSSSIFFNIYYTYYDSLLTGKGLINEASRAKVFSRLTYIIVAVTLLYLGLGLLGVALASFTAPFVNRFLSYRFFFTAELKKKIEEFNITNHEKIDLFKIIWHNSKKLGLVLVCAYASSSLGFFLAGLFLPLSEIASYGLMIQLVGILSGVSGTLFGIYLPRFSSLRIKGDNQTLIKDFAFSMNVSYIIFITGIIFLLTLGPWALRLIGSKTFLPPVWLIAIYATFVLLQVNHSAYATIITTRNDIPFLVPAIIASCVIAIGSYLSLKFTNLDILGLILIQGLTESAYDNWKWPLVVHKEFNIKFKNFITIGFSESVNRAKIYIYDRYRFF